MSFFKKKRGWLHWQTAKYLMLQLHFSIYVLHFILKPAGDGIKDTDTPTNGSGFL